MATTTEGEKVSSTRIRTTLEVDDDVFGRYEAQASALNSASKNGHVGAEFLMQLQLVRYSHVPVSERVLVVDAVSREKLEHLLSGGAIQSGVDLLEKVSRLADIKIGGIQIQFTPSQLTHIRRYATRNNITPDEAVRRIVKQMESQFFDFVSD